MKVYIEKDNRFLNLEHKSISGSDLLQELKINSSTAILVRNDAVVLEDEILEDSDDIKILSVVSGG